MNYQKKGRASEEKIKQCFVCFDVHWLADCICQCVGSR